MKRQKKNPAYARRKEVKQELTNPALDSNQIERLKDELKGLDNEIIHHEKKQREKFKNSFRTTSEATKKHAYGAELSDLRAFRHFLDSKVAKDKYNPRTLSYWLNKINKGEIPKIAEEVLRANGYKVKQMRKWTKPKGKDNGE